VVGLVVVRVDVDDHELAVLALAGLPLRVSEQLGGVEFLDGQTMDVI